VHTEKENPMEKKVQNMEGVTFKNLESPGKFNMSEL